MQIIKLTSNYLHQVEDIFFEASSIQNFKTKQSKNNFFYKYLGYYYKSYPELFFVLIQEEEVLGYICGAIDSKSCNELYELLPHYQLFDDLYITYSSHLHMNIRSNSRGKGIGGMLINYFCNIVKNSATGIHIITNPGVKNVQFYKKNGLLEITERSFMGSSLLLMGKKF